MKNEDPVQDSERTAPWEQVASAVRDGWHAAGGGRSQDCPGCPVCRVADATTVPPQTREHLGAALGHAVSAGRELLAALGAAGQATRGGPGAEPGRPDGPAPPTRKTDAEAADGGVPERVRIHVDHQEDTE